MAEAVIGHVFLTLLTFTLANAFRSSLGQELAKSGIKLQRAEGEDDNSMAESVHPLARHLLELLFHQFTWIYLADYL